MAKAPKPKEEQFSPEECEMIRCAVNLQLTELRQKYGNARRQQEPWFDQNEVDFYRERVEKWEPFVEKVNAAHNKAALANTLQDGGMNSDDEESEHDE